MRRQKRSEKVTACMPSSPCMPSVFSLVFYHPFSLLDESYAND